MLRKILLLFMTLALAAAMAKTFTVTFFQPSVVAGTELAPGDYRLDLQDNKVIIKRGKQKVEAAVKVENEPAKFSSTSVRYVASEGKARVQEIRLGGTNLKLVFD